VDKGSYSLRCTKVVFSQGGQIGVVTHQDGQGKGFSQHVAQWNIASFKVRGEEAYAPIEVNQARHTDAWQGQPQPVGHFGSVPKNLIK